MEINLTPRISHSTRFHIDHNITSICMEFAKKREAAFNIQRVEKPCAARHGAELVWTEMFPAKDFASAEYRERMFQTDGATDRPLVVQLCGHDPDDMVRAGMIAQVRRGDAAHMDGKGMFDQMRSVHYCIRLHTHGWISEACGRV